MRQWTLDGAKARLRELAKLAYEQEPQEAALRGAPAVVMLSRTALDQLTAPHRCCRCRPLKIWATGP